MEYERFTERVGESICIKETSSNDNRSIWNAIERLAELEDKIERGELVENKVVTYINMARSDSKALIDKAIKYDKLKDKIENGTLIELPCKVGDTVYVLDTDKISDKPKISEAIVADYNISSYDYSILVYEKKYSYYLWNCGLGFDWFTTKAEAEKKLKENENERN